jgi:hypothetical protein
MTDRSKFEQMLEYLIAEDQEKAKEIFHQLVVEKSREIYETILAEDFESIEESDDEDDEDEDEVQENFGFAEAGAEIGGDATDDFISDVEADGEEDAFGSDDEGGDEFGDEEGLEDRVVDLEDALDELKAEFDKLMADEGGEEDEGEEDMFGGDDEGEEDEGEEEMPPKKADEDFMREYIEKVTAPKMGDNGANTKSIVAKKNDMGGTTANILKGGESTTGGTKGGLLNPSTKEDDAGNVNVPGAKKAATLSKVTAPKGGDNGANSNSPLNGAPGRAK